MRRPRLVLSVSCLVATCLVALAALVRAEAPVVLPLVFHVASSHQVPVANQAFLDLQLASANRVFAPHGLALRAVEVRPLPEGHDRLESRGDRDALGAFLRKSAINCMVVGRLMDVDEPGRERRGVHWRVRKEPARRFVVVSAISGPYVLAHELGHYLGNPRHSEVEDNLMSYQQTGALPFLDPVQVRNVAQTVRTLLRTGELSAL